MVIETITAYNMSAGMHIPLVYANTVTDGLFIWLMAFALWIIITSGLYLSKKSFSGWGDFPLAATVSSFIVTISLGIIWGLIDGLADGYMVSVFTFITILSFLMLLFTKGD